MAVPKKRRIGSKLLNRGFKNRVLYSNMFKLTMSRLSLPYLTRVSDSHNLTSLKNRQLPISFGLVVTKKPAKEPGGKEITIVSMRRFFYTRPATFSPKALRLGFGNGSGIAPWQGGNTLTGAGNVDVDFWPIGLARRVSYTRHPYINSNFLFLYPSLNFLLKRSFFLSQVPHKWGSQKNLLLKKWELSPKHLFLTPVYEMSDTAFELHLGAIRIAHPKNLSTPRGPSLRDLWAYAKSNPNEGYWIYCMWLQVKKKWKRWVRFPLQYFLKRNILRRVAFTEHYKSSIPKYRGRLSTLTHGSDPGEGLGTKLPVKKTFEYPLSIFTRFALLLRDSSFLSKNEFNDKATRSKYLGRGLSKKPRVRGSSLTSSVFLKIILLIKRPWL